MHTTHDSDGESQMRTLVMRHVYIFCLNLFKLIVLQCNGFKHKCYHMSYVCVTCRRRRHSEVACRVDLEWIWEESGLKQSRSFDMTYTYMYVICMCVCMYIYIYIYIYMSQTL